tara:strand:+ start:310 stop:534 length:225 start_codon:yes stop_codon:yes gene_type:complete
MVVIHKVAGFGCVLVVDEESENIACKPRNITNKGAALFGRRMANSGQASSPMATGRLAAVINPQQHIHNSSRRW